MRCQNFTEEEKEKKRQYCCERNRILEDQKQKLNEYRRNYDIINKK